MNDSSGCEDYPGELVPLEKFNYRNKMMGCVILRSMGNVTLAGITVSSTLTCIDHWQHIALGKDCIQ